VRLSFLPKILFAVHLNSCKGAHSFIPLPACFIMYLSLEERPENPAPPPPTRRAKNRLFSQINPQLGRWKFICDRKKRRVAAACCYCCYQHLCLLIKSYGRGKREVNLGTKGARKKSIQMKLLGDVDIDSAGNNKRYILSLSLPLEWYIWWALKLRWANPRGFKVDEWTPICTLMMFFGKRFFPLFGMVEEQSVNYWCFFSRIFRLNLIQKHLYCKLGLGVGNRLFVIWDTTSNVVLDDSKHFLFGQEGDEFSIICKFQ
jgi:hypothetical protein